MPRQSDPGTIEFVKSYAVDEKGGQMSAENDVQVFDDTNLASANVYNAPHGEPTSGQRGSGD